MDPLRGCYVMTENYFWKESLTKNGKNVGQGFTCTERSRGIPCQGRIFYRIIQNGMFFLFFLFAKFYCRFKVYGIEKVDFTKPLILASNHTSFLDSLFILLSLPAKVRRRTYVLTASKLFSLPYLLHGLIARFANPISVERAGDFLSALQKSTAILKGGGLILIHPEGKMSYDGNFRPFKTGVGLLSDELGVPVVPIYIGGTFKVLKRTDIIPKPAKVTVHYGEEIDPKEFNTIGKKYARYRAITEKIKDDIIKLGKA